MLRTSLLQAFFKTGVLKNFAIFTGKHLCCRPKGLQIFKKEYQHNCFPVNIAKFFRAEYFYRTSLVTASQCLIYNRKKYRDNVYGDLTLIKAIWSTEIRLKMKFRNESSLVSSMSRRWYILLFTGRHFL